MLYHMRQCFTKKHVSTLFLSGSFFFNICHQQFLNLYTRKIKSYNSYKKLKGSAVSLQYDSLKSESISFNKILRADVNKTSFVSFSNIIRDLFSHRYINIYLFRIKLLFPHLNKTKFSTCFGSLAHHHKQTVKCCKFSTLASMHSASLSMHLICYNHCKLHVCLTSSMEPHQFPEKIY